MKTFKILGVLALISTFGPISPVSALGAEGRPILRQNPRSTIQAAPQEVENPGAASTEEDAAASDFHFGVGGTTWGSPISDIPLSVWVDLNGSNSLQIALGLGDVSPFKMHTAAAYRYTLDGDENQGFHVGLGGQFLFSVIGTSFSFDLKGMPLFGFHGRIPGLSKVGLSVDFGPEIAVSSTANVDFSVGGATPAMGLAVHYFF